MQLDPNTERLLAVRKAQGTALARQRYTGRYEGNTGERGLSYALLIIVLFQTILLSCAIFAFGGLLLLNFSYVLYRPPVDAYALASLGRTPSPTATLPPTPTPLETATPIAPPATATLPAAPTPVPPTDTPVANTVNSPIALPPPTPTFMPVNPAPDSATIQVYANQILPPLNNLMGAIQGLRALAQNPNINDAQWVANVKVQLNSLQANQEQIRLIPSPPEVQEAHNALLNVLNTCRGAADIINTSISNNNPGNLGAALPLIENCNAQFPTVDNSLRQLLRAKGIIP